MVLTETDVNRALGSMADTQKAIANISWSADKENAAGQEDVVRAVSSSRSTAVQSPSNPYHAIPDIGFVDSFVVRCNCNQLRTKINTFINNGGMKGGEFQKKLGVPPNSYLSFMRQSGPHAGSGNNTYAAAHQFFTQLEDSGLKMPRAKKGTAKNNKEFNEKNDVSGIHLDREEEGNVPIYDTCDDVRNKINARLRTESTTQAAFCWGISKCQAPGATPIQFGQLKSFLRKKGPLADNTSKTFYAAYVYFEKLRIKHNKKKSKKREEMEAHWRHEGGVDTQHDQSKGMWLTMGESESAYMNKYGITEIVTARGRLRGL